MLRIVTTEGTKGAVAPRGTLGRARDRARAESFVGRAAEQSLWRQWLEDGSAPFCVLWLFGPGGVGKTALLQRFAEIAEAVGRRAHLVSARELSPGEPLAALFDSGGPPLTNAARAAELARFSGGALLIDTAELLPAEQSWLWEELLPAVPEDCPVAVASRKPPDARWLSDPGWSRLVHTVGLRNLSRIEANDLLARRGVAADQQGRLFDVTQGHPLALSLIAEVVKTATNEGAALPECSPHVVQALLERFLAHVPSAERREALQLAAHCRTINEATLRDLLDAETAAGIYDWVSSLSFIERTSDGLTLHELAAHALDRGLLSRDPERYVQLHLRIRRRLFGLLRQSEGTDALRIALDCAWLHRFSPVMRSVVAWDAALRLYGTRPTRSDSARILDAARRYQSEALARAFEAWLELRPEAFLVLRSSEERSVGFTFSLLLRDHEEALATRLDPYAAAAFSHARATAPLRPSEGLALHWAFDFDQPIQAPSRIVLHLCAQYIARWYTTPRLGLSYHWLPWSLAEVPGASSVTGVRARSALDDWLALFVAHRHEHTRREVLGRECGLAWHDWRREPPDRYAEVMGHIELHGELGLVEEVSEPLLVLSESAFREHIRQALRDYRDLRALGRNPLCRSRLVRNASRPEGAVTPASDPGLVTATRLQGVLLDAAERLGREVNDQSLYACLKHAYLEPAPTQDIAAEIVGLPFSTFRRRLAAALAQLGDWLWARELEAGD